MKFVRLIDLPTSVRGLTVLDSEGNYNVYLNSRLSYEMQENTYIHETEHIENGDFYSDLPTTLLEKIAEYKSKI